MEPDYRVGQYVFEKPLGQGGMAEVWLARNVHLGTPAAIKFLNRAYAGVSDVEQRFINEGRRQGLLSHPNIVKVYGFEYVDGHSFLILQYVDGESLEDLLQRVGRLDTAESLRIGISVLNGLDYAHTEQIVHRDIKPSNILIDKHGFPYLGDFGIVLAVDEERRTRTGTSMGTALYMSPEQIVRPGSVDRRSDIYSFGCVLYEMLAGDPPFYIESTGDGSTDFLIKTAHVQQSPPPLRGRNASVSAAIESVVMRCLAKNPADRYATCRELRDALSAALVARPPSPLSAPAPIPSPRREATVIEPPRASLDVQPPRSQRIGLPVIVVLALLALLAIAGTIWIIVGHQPSSESSETASSQVPPPIEKPPPGKEIPPDARPPAEPGRRAPESSKPVPQKVPQPPIIIQETPKLPPIVVIDEPPPVKKTPPADKSPTEPGRRAPESSKPAPPEVPQHPPIDEPPPVKRMPPVDKPPTEVSCADKTGGPDSNPELISKQEAEYSDKARAAKLEGDVKLVLVVDESGNPRNIKVLERLGMGLDQKAIEAVEKWKFCPAKKDGKPVAKQATVFVHFRLL